MNSEKKGACHGYDGRKRNAVQQEEGEWTRVPHPSRARMLPRRFPVPGRRERGGSDHLRCPRHHHLSLIPLKEALRSSYSKFYGIFLVALAEGYRRIGCKSSLRECPAPQDESPSRSQMEPQSPVGAAEPQTLSSRTSYGNTSPTKNSLKLLLRKNRYATLTYLLAQAREEGLEEELLRMSIIGLSRDSIPPER